MNSPFPHLPMSSPDTNTLLSVAEAAKLLRVSRTTVWRWIEADKLPAYRVGPKNIRIKKQDLEKVVQPARETPKKGGLTMERVRFEKPTQKEIERRKAVAAQMLALRQKLNIAPLSSADLIRMAREEEQSAYGKPRTTR